MKARQALGTAAVLAVMSGGFARAEDSSVRQATAPASGAVDDISTGDAVGGGVQATTSTINSDPKPVPPAPGSTMAPRKDDGTASPTRDGLGTRPEEGLQ
jgi:hypothetical protein